MCHITTAISISVSFSVLTLLVNCQEWCQGFYKKLLPLVLRTSLLKQVEDEN